MKFQILFISIISTIIFNLVSTATVTAWSSPLLNQISNTLTANHSRNWSGYVATGSGYTGVSGTWTVPSIKDPSSGADATWIGIGGVNSDDLIQTGTQATVTNAGNVSYQAWYEMLPGYSRPLGIPVAAGDSVTASLSQQSDNTWLISFKDNTNGKSVQITKSYTSSLSSAEWVEEAPSGGRMILPLDNFNSVSFSNAVAVKNEQTLNISQLNAKPVNMVNSLRQTLVSVSNVESDGSSFTIQRQADIASTPQNLGDVYLRIGYSDRDPGRVVIRQWVVPATQIRRVTNGHHITFWQSLSAFLSELNLPGTEIVNQISLIATC